mgnify:CR=1 FL=1
MKKKIVSLMAVAAMLLGTACSNQLDDVDVMNNGVVKLEETSALTDDDFWGENLSYDEIDVDAYIETHTETFGNVLDFNSIDDVVDLLDEMSGMNYQDLSSKYEDLRSIRGFSNDIIESNILYDKIYTEVAVKFGYDLLKKEEEIDNDDFFEALEIRLLETNNSLISMQEKTYTDSETNETISGVFIEPICGLGIDALVNEKHIVIIDKSVLYFIEDAIVSMPINKYHHLADYQFSSLETLEMALYSNGITGLTIGDFVISYRGRQGVQNETFEKTEKNHIGFNSSKDRMMTVDIGAYETQYYFVTLVGELTIVNYKKNRLRNWVKMWSHVEGGGVSFQVYYKCDRFSYSQLMDFDFGIAQYVRGQRTFQRYRYIGLIPIYDIQPYDISIGLQNWQGCHIQY